MPVYRGRWRWVDIHDHPVDVLRGWLCPTRAVLSRSLVRSTRFGSSGRLLASMCSDGVGRSKGAALTSRGFLNGIIAYGTAKMHHSSLASWRVLYIIEGVLTVFIGVLCLLILPEDIQTSRWFSDEEKEYSESYNDESSLISPVLEKRRRQQSTETNKINWPQAWRTLIRWQQFMRRSNG